MAFNIVVNVTAQGTEKIDQTTEKLDDATAAAKQTTDTLTKLGPAAAQAGKQAAEGLDATATAASRARGDLDALNAITGKLQAETRALAGVSSQQTAEWERMLAAGKASADRQAEILERIQAPMRQYEADVQALNALLEKGQIDLADYTREMERAAESAAHGLGPVQGPAYKQDLAGLSFDPMQGPAYKQELAGLSFDPMQGPAFDPNQAGRGLTQELQRERDLLEQIHGPVQRYEQDLATLDALLKKDQISLEQYDAQLAKVQKRAESAGAIAPVQGPQQQTAPTAPTGGSSLQSLAGGASLLLAGGAAAGFVALGEHIDSLIGGYRDIQDVAIKAANAVQRFTDESHSATLVMDQQRELATQLHATYSQTVGLYGRLAEQADMLSLSQGELTTLTKEFGEAVQLTGKPIDAADGIMRRFAYGLAAGKIETRELRQIMREVPAVAELWTKAFGVTTDQLKHMVQDGRISTEDLMGSLLKGSQAIEDKFQKLQETHAQARDRWLEDEKILSQRYDVGFGAGHSAQAAVDKMAEQAGSGAEGWRQIAAAAEQSGKMGELATAALRKVHEENRAAVADTLRDLTNLTGAFRPIGDAYRKWIGDTAAVRAEVQKLNEPIDAARAEIDTLNHAFGSGKIDIETYEKEYAKLQTVLQRGTPPEAYKLNAPIEAAKKSLEDLNAAFGRNDITFDQYRKEYTALTTTIEGHMPVLEKIRQPIEDARVALAELSKEQRAGTITGEEFRREYDSLMTTINDGRLPEAIKIWEEINLPVRDAGLNFAALNALLRQGRIDVSDYETQLKKIVDTHLSGEAVIISDGIARLHKEFADGLLSLRGYDAAVEKLIRDYQTLHRTASGISYRIAPQGPETDAGQLSRITQQQLYLPSVTGNADVRAALAQIQSTALVSGTSDEMKQLNEQFERANKLANEFVAPAVKYEQALKDIATAAELHEITEDQATAARRRAKDTLNQENEALEAQKGPMEQYEATLRKLKDQLEAGDIAQKQYDDGIDKARVTMLQATGAANTFRGAMQIEWIKLKQEADSFGATVANMAVSDFGKLNDAIVTMANGGQVSWSQMADSMIQDLERIALKMLEVKAISGLIGLFGGEGAAAVADTAAHYATGGSFTVGGDGGTDTTPVGFWATRGERVTITPPGAYPYPQAPSPAMYAQGMQQAPVVHVHNHYDSSVGLATIQSPNGQSAILNVLRANAPAIRGALGIKS